MWNDGRLHQLLDPILSDSRHELAEIVRCAQVALLTVFGRLELEWCERKTLLPDWWLEASAGGM